MSPSKAHSPFSVKVLMSPPSPEFKVKFSWREEREEGLYRLKPHWLFEWSAKCQQLLIMQSTSGNCIKL